MAKLQVMTLENLELYDGLIKKYVDAADAKSLKTATLEGNVLKIYRVSEPVGDTEPAYELTLPETDVSGLLAKLTTTNVGNVIVSKADGTIEDGGVKLTDLATKTEVEAVDAKADANAKAITAINDEETGVLAQAKAYADGKDTTIAEAKSAADDAQADVDALEEVVAGMYTNDQIDEAIEAAKTASTYDDTKVKADIAANASAIEAINNADTGILKTAQTYTDTKVKELADGQVKTNTDAIATLNGDATTEGSVAKAVKDSADSINATIGTVEEGKTVVQMISEAKTAAIYDDTEVRELIADNAEAIKAHKTAIDDTVTTLVGDDTGKSVRTIANEELAAQLIGENAKESLDTLEEIAAWIQSHPDDASAMNKAITDLEALVGTLPEGVTATTVVSYVQELVNAEKSRAEGVESGLDTRLQALETAIGEGGSVDTQIGDAIAELDADVTSATVEVGKGVQVQVVEVDGKITTVNVTGNYDNAYDAKGTAAAAVTALETGAVSTNTTNIEALQGLVGEGYEAIPEASINALFS